MAKTVILTKKDGRVTLDQELPYVFSTLSNGTYTITIKKASEKRSIMAALNMVASGLAMP